MSNWSDENVDMLRRLYKERLSSSQIAMKLGGGLSRNAVIGKVHRLGLDRPLGETGPRVKHTRSTTPRKPKVKNSRPSALRIVASGRNGGQRLVFVNDFEQPPIRELSAADIPIKQRKTLMQLKSDDCRWPYGDPGGPGDFFFCAAPKECGSYCGTHARVSRGRPALEISDAERERRRWQGRQMAERNKDKRRGVAL